MKITFSVFLAFFFISCSNLIISPNSGKSTNIKLDGINKIVFRDGDIIYFTNIDSSGVSFQFTENESVKKMKPKDKIFEEFEIGYNHSYANEIFQPFYRRKIDSTKSPKSYIADEFNKFSEILKGENRSALEKYKHKRLEVKKIGWDEINDLVGNEIYYRNEDSLRIIIPMPKDIISFCESIRFKHSDAKYLILCKNVYLTYNLFGGGNGKWIVEQSGIRYVEPKKDVSLLFAPKIVIDVELAKILSIDTNDHFISDWANITSDIKRIIEEEAEFYNLRF